MNLMTKSGLSAGVLLFLLISSGCVSFPKRLLCFLSPNRYYVNDVVLRQDHLEKNDHNNTYKYAGTLEALDYVTIHNTWNVAPARSERAYLNRRKDKQYISFQYAVDEAEGLEILPVGSKAWHAGDGQGDGNNKSIGIEICRSRCEGDQEALYRRSEENAVNLAAYLLWANRLPLDNLRKHQDWSGKNCPHRILDENRWEEFCLRVKGRLECLKFYGM